MNATITTRYVNIAWGKFLCIAFDGEAALCSCEVRASCNGLRERWHIKTYRSMARGTNQKTEDFCHSNKLGFGLWGINLPI
jgi:hypothetical protein